MDRRNFIKVASAAVGGTFLTVPAFGKLDDHGQEVLKKVGEGDPEATKELAEALEKPLYCPFVEEGLNVTDPRFGKLINISVNLEYNLEPIFELGHLEPFPISRNIVQTLELTFQKDGFKRTITYKSFSSGNLPMRSYESLIDLFKTAIDTTLTNCFSTHNVSFTFNNSIFRLDSIGFYNV